MQRGKGYPHAVTHRISRAGTGSHYPGLGEPLTREAAAEVAQLWRDLGNVEAVLAIIPHRWWPRAELLIEEIRKAENGCDT